MAEIRPALTLLRAPAQAPNDLPVEPETWLTTGLVSLRAQFGSPSSAACTSRHAASDAASGQDRGPAQTIQVSGSGSAPTRPRIGSYLPCHSPNPGSMVAMKPRCWYRLA